MSILRRLFGTHFVRQGFFDVYAQVKEGRMVLALEKLDELHNEFPSYASVFNEKGNIHSKYLGCGKRAHELYCEALTLDGNFPNALINATDYSPTEQEFRARSAEALRRVANPQFTGRIRQVLERLDGGVPYGVFLAATMTKDAQLKKFGLSAAFAELLLGQGGMSGEEELRTRRHRAQCLRELDIAAVSSYSARGEAFPASERLALLEAVLELDRATALDEYDHELWNLKAAWCVLLERFEDSLRCADTSLQNAPADYIKPLVNKVVALTTLGRESETRQCLEEALRRVKGDEGHADIVQMKRNMCMNP